MGLEGGFLTVERVALFHADAGAATPIADAATFAITGRVAFCTMTPLSLARRRCFSLLVVIFEGYI